MAEKLYTLEQARQEIADTLCNIHGHDFALETNDNKPISVGCLRCGKTWKVIKQPKRKNS